MNVKSMIDILTAMAFATVLIFTVPVLAAENRDRFAAEPEKFAPQYGGYCAYGVAKGSAAKIDPEAWHIVRGKLYLNYSKGIQMKWVDNQVKYITAADKNWPIVLN